MPNEITHTPGPWSIGADRVGVADDEIPVYEPNGGCICGVWQMGEDFDGENDDANARANARLIAAAPDMLAALHEIAAMNGTYCGVAVEVARAAIAKAEGRS